MTYNRDELLQLNHAHASVSSYTLHSSILVHMKYLGILQHQYKKRPAHRGKKGGRRRSEKRPRLSSPIYPTHDSTASCHLPANSTDIVQRLRFALWNAHSINAKEKSTALCDFVISHQMDILAITETWLTGDERDHCTIADIKGEVQSRITIISKGRVKISIQIGAKIMKIG